jgi:hypothetical protein
MSGKSAHPVPAVYLCHVALECALKLRILVKNNATHVEDLKRFLQKEDFESLFYGKSGHDLHHLERTAGLRRYLVASGRESLLEDGGWAKMGGARPYSLRYGVENVQADEAAEQVRFAVKLTDIVLQGGVGVYV